MHDTRILISNELIINRSRQVVSELYLRFSMLSRTVDVSVNKTFNKIVKTINIVVGLVLSLHTWSISTFCMHCIQLMNNANRQVVVTFVPE